MMRSVTITFWIVRNRFSPYVEKGNPLRAEYASVIAYESVSRMYADRDRPRAERALTTINHLHCEPLFLDSKKLDAYLVKVAVLS